MTQTIRDYLTPYIPYLSSADMKLVDKYDNNGTKVEDVRRRLEPARLIAMLAFRMIGDKEQAVHALYNSSCQLKDSHKYHVDQNIAYMADLRGEDILVYPKLILRSLYSAVPYVETPASARTWGDTGAWDCIDLEPVKKLLEIHKTNLDKILAALTKATPMTVGRAVVRFSAAKELNADDKNIIATKFAEMHKPATILYATDVDSYLDMYNASLHSCMTNNSSTKKWSVAEDIDPKFHPTNFYACCPFIRGVYYKQGTKTMGRVLTYKKSDGVWYWGRIYAFSPAARNAMISAMQKAGMKPLNGKIAYDDSERVHRYEDQHTIEIPITGKRYIPIPYLDNMYKSLVLLSMDKDKTKITVGVNHPPGTGLFAIPTRDAAGVFHVATFDKPLCPSCKRPAKVTEHYAIKDGLYTCGNRACEDNLGYIRYFRSDSDTRLMHKEDMPDTMYKEPYTNDWFVSLDAYLKLFPDAGPCVEIANFSPLMLTEESFSTFSREGNYIFIDKQRVHVSREDFNALHVGGYLTEKFHLIKELYDETTLPVTVSVCDPVKFEHGYETVA